MKKLQISRRTMLRGMGAMLSLPLLDAMAPVSLLAANEAKNTASRKYPVRTAVLYMANGVNPNTWAPKGTGADFELSPALEPLRNVKDQILVLQQLMNAATDTGDGHY